jgi:hypothetical protein
MKKLLFMLILFITVNLFGQSNNVSVTPYVPFYRDTLTTSLDTMDIKFQSGFDYYTISVYTTTGTDTVNVYSKGEGDYAFYVQKALIDLTNNNLVTQIIVSTTPKEYLLQDPGTMYLRLITPDASANTVFTVNAKKGNYAINASNASVILTGGAKFYTTYIDTVVKRASVRTDTLLINGAEWAKITVKGMAATDSLEYAVGLTAPTTFSRQFGVTPISTERLNKTYFTKVFLRAFGVTSSVRTYQVIIEAF